MLKNIFCRNNGETVGKGRFFLIISCVMLAGMLTWLTCDGIIFIWRASTHPPLTPPFAVVFILWMIAYFLLGALIVLSTNTCGDDHRITFRSTCAYLISLFWCPLALRAGAWLLASVALAMSLLFTASAVMRLRVRSRFAVLLYLCIIVHFVYFLILSVGMIFIC